MMYSQNNDFSHFELPLNDKPGGAGLNLKKPWYRLWWGRLILVFLIIFFILLFALVFYIGQLALLLRRGIITPDQLFGRAASQGIQTYATKDDPGRGPKTAKVVIVEFGDFECPACRQEFPVVSEILKNYGDQIYFVFRDFPLIEDHPKAATAALAAGCAQEQGKFWDYYNKLFSMAEITEQGLASAAIAVGLNGEQFIDCLKSAKYLDEIENDLNDGYAAGVRATPTFFINGVKVAGAIPLAVFEKAIISELSR